MEKLTPQQIADKTLGLTEQFNPYVFAAPEILDHIPNKSMLIFLDADAPEFNRVNIALTNAAPRPADTSVAYVRMQKRVRMIQQIEWQPEIVASPLAV